MANCCTAQNIVCLDDALILVVVSVWNLLIPYRKEKPVSTRLWWSSSIYFFPNWALIASVKSARFVSQKWWGSTTPRILSHSPIFPPSRRPLSEQSPSEVSSLFRIILSFVYNCKQKVYFYLIPVVSHDYFYLFWFLSLNLIHWPFGAKIVSGLDSAIPIIFIFVVRYRFIIHFGL